MSLLPQSYVVIGGLKMTLYSMDDCPWCVLVKKRLDFAKINYTEVKDIEVIKAKEFPTVPRLELADGQILDHNEAIAWINNQRQL